MKQEHEMTPGVLVSGEVLSAGDARARVAVLEAEVAELRKRAVPADLTAPKVGAMLNEAAGHILWLSDALMNLGDDCGEPHDSAAETEFMDRLQLVIGRFASLSQEAAAPAPVERVEQEAVAMLLIDDASAEESGEWDIEPITAVIEKLARSGGATLPLYTTPQPAAPADPWEPSGVEYDRAIHHNPDAKAWADLFVQTFPAQADRHELMLAWFANAMMAMHDHLAQKEKPAAQDVAGLVEALKRVEMTRDERLRAGPLCAAHWDNAIVVCIEVVEKHFAAHQSGGSK